jgi:hypothetical protein
MSHFTVLVVGDNVDEQLEPFHEFECTGLEKYIKEIDKTEELRKEYEEHTTRKLKSPDGELVDPYDDRFYREPTQEELDDKGPFGKIGASKRLHTETKDWGDGLGRRVKVHFVPIGWEDVKVPTQEYKSFAEFIEYWTSTKTVPFGEEVDVENDDYKYGYVLVDDKGEVIKAIDRTNPNSKWDWYSIGGRWSGMFRLKPGAEGETGCPGVMGTCSNDGPEYADQALKGDIDFEFMRNEAKEKAEEEYEEAMKAIQGLTRPEWNSWNELRESMDDIDKARDIYRDDPFFKALRQVNAWEPEKFLVDKESFIERASRNAVQTFAILKDGKWYEEGEMGWFACVSNKKEPEDWDELYFQILESIPDDVTLTVVDCHI